MVTSEDRCARGMDLKKAVAMGVDEVHVALREAFADLSDDQFHEFALEGHSNIATLVMHVLQQHDDFNGNLQYRLGRKGPVNDWHFREFEKHWVLWGLSAEELAKPGDDFPTVAEALKYQKALHEALMTNLQAMSEADLIAEGPGGRWPRLCDIFFRAIWHAGAHMRQVWFLRGVMGVKTGWPVQHFA
jgi:hypothetical protein